MNTLQIEKILKSHHATRSSFLGCFAADQLINLNLTNKKFPCSLVANTDISTQPGEHWVCMYLSNSTCIDYFDSFAENPNNYISDFLSRFTKVQTNQLPVQNLFSDACGHFCIYVVVKRSCGISFDSIIRFLYKIQKADTFVKNFVHMLIA